MSLSFVLSGKMSHCQKAVQKMFSHHYDIVQLNYGSASTKRAKWSQDALQCCRWCWMLALFKVLHSNGARRPSRGAGGSVTGIPSFLQRLWPYVLTPKDYLIWGPWDVVARRIGSSETRDPTRGYCG